MSPTIDIVFLLLTTLFLHLFVLARSFNLLFTLLVVSPILLMVLSSLFFPVWFPNPSLSVLRVTAPEET